MAQQKRLGTVLERLAQENKLLASISEFDVQWRSGLYGVVDPLSFGYLGDLDPIDQFIKMISYRIIASNMVITSMAELYILESGASPAFGSTNTRWDVASISETAFRPLYRIEESEF